MPKVDTTLAQLSKSMVFSKLDANSGIKLSGNLNSAAKFPWQLIWGCWLPSLLPLGGLFQQTAVRNFQHTWNISVEVLSDLPGVLCHVDDVLNYGKDKEEYNSRLHTTLQRIKAAGITLNRDNCLFNQTPTDNIPRSSDQSEWYFPRSKETAAIQKMATHTSVLELRYFMGMVNWMNKFFPNIAQISKPLRDVLSTKVT